MKIIDPGFEVLDFPTDPVTRIAAAARTCYKSEDKASRKSNEALVRGLIKSGHHSQIEHVGATVKITCDRGVSHELVRHRLAAYSQESTRYVNYSKDKFGNKVTFIRPHWAPELTTPALDLDAEMTAKLQTWHRACLQSEAAYLEMLKTFPAQDARAVLNNSVKTEVVVTANMREWRHIFKLRCSPAAHPEIRRIMRPLLRFFNFREPVLFEDIYEEIFC